MKLCGEKKKKSKEIMINDEFSLFCQNFWIFWGQCFFQCKYLNVIFLKTKRCHIREIKNSTFGIHYSNVTIMFWNLVAS
jgi:hypothetical protein